LFVAFFEDQLGMTMCAFYVTAGVVMRTYIRTYRSCGMPSTMIEVAIFPSNTLVGLIDSSTAFRSISPKIIQLHSMRRNKD
jgi:hypothetical protein